MSASSDVPREDPSTESKRLQPSPEAVKQRNQLIAVAAVCLAVVGAIMIGRSQLWASDPEPAVDPWLQSQGLPPAWSMGSGSMGGGGSSSTPRSSSPRRSRSSSGGGSGERRSSRRSSGGGESGPASRMSRRAQERVAKARERVRRGHQESTRLAELARTRSTTLPWGRARGAGPNFSEVRRAARSTRPGTIAAPGGLRMAGKGRLPAGQPYGYTVRTGSVPIGGGGGRRRP